MSGKKRATVFLSEQEDLELAQRLSKEVGVKIVDFSLTSGEPTEFNPLVPDMPTGIREIIRIAALEEAGCELINPEFFSGAVLGRDIDNKKIFRGNIKETPAVISDLLQKPIHLAYDWDRIAYWDLGDFEALLQSLSPTGYLLIEKVRVLLFSDEIARLNNGEVVTPIYWGGLNSLGIVEDKLDTYAVRDGRLYRVWAHLID